MANFSAGPRLGETMRVLLVSGAKQIVMQLIEAFGFAAIDLGGLLDASRKQQAGGPLATGRDLLVAGDPVTHWRQARRPPLVGCVCPPNSSISRGDLSTSGSYRKARSSYISLYNSPLRRGPSHALESYSEASPSALQRRGQRLRHWSGAFRVAGNQRAAFQLPRPSCLTL
jgi:hypothetical protein